MPPGGVHAFDTKGTRGLIVVDPLGSVGTARAALDEVDLAAGRTAVIAPDRFMEEVIAESVVAGNAMSRRAAYQFGAPLPRGPRGTVDAGLGKIDSVGAPGRSIVPPTVSITQAIDTRTIDGVTRTPRTRCTTCCLCAARRCVMPASGRPT